MRYISASDIIRLLDQDGIYSASGKITMELNNISVICKEHDSIGNLLQEWLGSYLRNKEIYCRPPAGQKFPDFYLSDSNTEGLCEMKSYLYPKSPAFDVANFQTYIKSLQEHPERLNTDYLIVNYSAENGIIGIKKMWVKKVWEITGPADGYALKCQRKNGQLVNIRPSTWTATTQRYPPFCNPIEFLRAVSDTIQHEHNSRAKAREWRKCVIDGYLSILPESELAIQLSSES
ncbi:MAG: NgoBV family restriction endonuclease [Victivallales bacterium]